jgi:hippurate hydrolase
MFAGEASIAGSDRAKKLVAGFEAIFPDIDRLYRELHQNPELSLQEEKTAARLATGCKAAGFEVATGIGGHGLVCLLRNGPGPVAMLRTDLDALPVEEKTGLPYASRVVSKREGGEAVPVMHACGHDLHMSAWLAAGTLLARNRDLWRGTLILVGQPAEEVGQGARAMIESGLFERFPKPEFAFAIHASAELPAGTVGFTPGYALASADSVDVLFRGRGGHGAYPHRTVDPIVLAAKFIVSLQSVVSREVSPLEAAVVTVGSIHGGTKHNIVPDEVKLELTVRAHAEEVRAHLLEAIRRIARAEAQAARASEPEVSVRESTPATFNDPALTRRLASAIAELLGEENVRQVEPVMGAEDFSEYGRAGPKAAIFWVGTVDPALYERAMRERLPLPSLHSPLFAPDRERALRTAVAAFTAAALELLGVP